MPKYTVYAEVPVLISVECEAETPEKAMEMAKGAEVWELCNHEWLEELEGVDPYAVEETEGTRRWVAQAVGPLKEDS